MEKPQGAIWRSASVRSAGTLMNFSMKLPLSAVGESSTISMVCRIDTANSCRSLGRIVMNRKLHAKAASEHATDPRAAI